MPPSFDEAPKKTNRLINEKSPYLLQHAANPVDWYPWGEEAFAKAQAEDRPIFLSIGYATCHWCHVMAHESFEDGEVARLLNDFFIAVKVDREERPDIDHIYMEVCQSMTGSGGWPLSVFMTPGKVPFFAGTYFPPKNRGGMIGFADLLSRIHSLWALERERILKTGEEVRRALQSKEAVAPGIPLGLDNLQRAFEQLERNFDEQWGGFCEPPKFPTPHQLTFLLCWGHRTGNPRALKMVDKTLTELRRGGIFDQIGFGFHRYSVDEKWRLPHFEKMLYDQALLCLAYTEAFQVTGQDLFGRTAKEIMAYILRDMTAPEGGFYSAEDADSEGREGSFYAWTLEEMQKLLGKDLGDLFARYHGMTRRGNFSAETNILHLPIPLEAFAARENMKIEELEIKLEEAREKLFREREERIHPLKDDKILTAWNGLMIAALAKGAQVFGSGPYAEAAHKAADFILDRMRNGDGRLYRRYRQGDLAHLGYLDDYAFLVWGLLELYETTFDLKYLESALDLNRLMLDLFADGKKGGFFFTAKDSEVLITRQKDFFDGALPAANSVAALNLLRLGRMTGNSQLEDEAESLIRAFSQSIGEYPMAFTQWMMAIDFLVGPTQEIVVAGDPRKEPTREMIAITHQNFLPRKILMLLPEGEDAEKTSRLAPFLKAMRPVTGQATVYLCKNYSCQIPMTDVAAVRTALLKPGMGQG